MDGMDGMDGMDEMDEMDADGRRWGGCEGVRLVGRGASMEGRGSGRARRVGELVA